MKTLLEEKTVIVVIGEYLPRSSGCWLIFVSILAFFRSALKIFIHSLLGLMSPKIKKLFLGVLIGRYPGDSYAGGNPWPLLTAVTAELFYLGGQATLKKIKENGNFALTSEENKEWLSLLNVRLIFTLILL